MHELKKKKLERIVQIFVLGLHSGRICSLLFKRIHTQGVEEIQKNLVSGEVLPFCVNEDEVKVSSRLPGKLSFFFS